MPELGDLLRRQPPGRLYGVVVNRRSDFRHFPGFRDLAPRDQRLVYDLCEGARDELVLLHDGRILLFSADGGSDEDGEQLQGYRVRSIEPTGGRPEGGSPGVAGPSPGTSTGLAPGVGWLPIASFAILLALVGAACVDVALRWSSAPATEPDPEVREARIAERIAKRLDAKPFREEVARDVAQVLDIPRVSEQIARMIVSDLDRQDDLRDLRLALKPDVLMGRIAAEVRLALESGGTIKNLADGVQGSRIEGDIASRICTPEFLKRLQAELREVAGLDLDRLAFVAGKLKIRPGGGQIYLLSEGQMESIRGSKVEEKFRSAIEAQAVPFLRH